MGTTVHSAWRTAHTVTILPPQPTPAAQRIGRDAYALISRVAALYPEMAEELHAIQRTFAAVMRLDGR